MSRGYITLKQLIRTLTPTLMVPGFSFESGPQPENALIVTPPKHAPGTITGTIESPGLWKKWKGFFYYDIWSLTVTNDKFQYNKMHLDSEASVNYHVEESKSHGADITDKLTYSFQIGGTDIIQIFIWVHSYNVSEDIDQYAITRFWSGNQRTEQPYIGPNLRIRSSKSTGDIITEIFTAPNNESDGLSELREDGEERGTETYNRKRRGMDVTPDDAAGVSEERSVRARYEDSARERYDTTRTRSEDLPGRGTRSTRAMY